MKAFFKDKLEYNHKCNQLMIELIEQNPKAYTQVAQKLICHSLNAQNVWTTRILKQKNEQGVWDVFKIEELHALNDHNHNLSLKMLRETDLNEMQTYTNTVGDTFTNKVEDMLYHLINHGMYHRGQLITELKSQGVTPIPVDYIFFKR